MMMMIYLDLTREQKKLHDGDGDTNGNWSAWKDLQRLVKGTGRGQAVTIQTTA